MILTLAQICSTATTLVQNRTDITPSDASFWANIAYTEIATRIRYRAEESLAISSTTSGENRISLPSDFGYPISVSNLSTGPTQDGRSLQQREAQTFDSRDTTLGTPTEYALYSTWMELWPSPDSSYSIQLRYGAKLSSLVTSTSTPAIDDRYHPAIAFLTAAYLAGSKNDLESEAVNKARYLSYMGSTPNDAALQQRDKLSNRVQFLRNPLT